MISSLVYDIAYIKNMKKLKMNLQKTLKKRDFLTYAIQKFPIPYPKIAAKIKNLQRVNFGHIEELNL